jgi:hypothetical protein
VEPNGKFLLSVRSRKSGAAGWDLNVRVEVWPRRDQSEPNPPSSTIQVKMANDPLVLNLSSIAGSPNLGTSVDGSISVTGAFGTPTFTQTGLPPGSSINPNNLACGSICVVRVVGAAEGTYPVTFGVTVPGGWSASANKTITVTAAPLAINASAVGTNADINKSYSGQVTSSGGTGSNTWSISGQPAGLGINQSGLISGTVSSAALQGAYPTTVTVTDSANNSKQATFTMNVASGVIAMSISASTGDIWQTTSHPNHQNVQTVLMYKNEFLTKTVNFAFDGGTAPYTMSSSNSNWGPGMTRTGLTVTGDPNASGDLDDITQTITVNDAAGRSKQFTIGWMLANRPTVRMSSALPSNVQRGKSVGNLRGNGGGGFDSKGWASNRTALITDMLDAPNGVVMTDSGSQSSLIFGKPDSMVALKKYNISLRYRDPYTNEYGSLAWDLTVEL